MRRVFVILIIVLGSTVVYGYSFSTYKEQVLSVIGDILNDYQKAHPREPIPSFSELATNNGLALERIERNLEQPITNVFHILEEKDRFSAPAPHEGTVVVIMTAPSLDGRYGDEPVRRIIYQDKSGVFRSRTVNEAAIQTEADKVGYRLPQGELIRENIPQYILDWGRPSSQTNANATSNGVVMNNGGFGAEHPAEAESRKNPEQAYRPTHTNAIVAAAEAPSASTRWWLPMAVLAGLGSIVALLIRARRRAGKE